jgi:hypothetical protein
MTSNPLGMCLNGSSGGADYSHPFPVYVSAGRARVGRGLILCETAVEPLIGTVPIGGDKKSPTPSLKLDPALVNERKESWVCVEVTPDQNGKVTDPEGKLLTGAKVEVVQRSGPYVTTGRTGRAPLALISFVGKAPQAYQIAMFHFRYETAQSPNGQRRHYFT